MKSNKNNIRFNPEFEVDRFISRLPNIYSESGNSNIYWIICPHCNTSIQTGFMRDGECPFCFELIKEQ